MKVSNSVGATASYDHLARKESVQFGNFTVTVYSHTASDFPDFIAPIIEGYKQLYCKVVDNICNGQLHYTQYMIEYRHSLAEHDVRFRCALSGLEKDECPAFDGKKGAPAVIPRISGFVQFLGECQRNQLTRLVGRKRSIFCESANGRYPLRSVNGDSIKITRLRHYPVSPGLAGDLNLPHLEYKNVLPFVKEFAGSGESRKSISESERSELYAAMICRRIEPADLLGPKEASLVGQNGVFAVTAIKEGTCLGVYGGTLIRGEALISISGDKYVFANDTLDEKKVPVVGICGENILSRINTAYIYSCKGEPVRENAAASNVSVYLYPADLADGTTIELACCFAKREILPGEELRLTYDQRRLEHGKGLVKM